MSSSNASARTLIVSAGLLLGSGGVMAQQFDGGLPAGWNCFGNCGTSADVTVPGVVAPSPVSGSYG